MNQNGFSFLVSWATRSAFADDVWVRSEELQRIETRILRNPFGRNLRAPSAQSPSNNHRVAEFFKIHGRITSIWRKEKESSRPVFLYLLVLSYSQIKTVRLWIPQITKFYLYSLCLSSFYNFAYRLWTAYPPPGVRVPQVENRWPVFLNHQVADFVRVVINWVFLIGLFQIIYSTWVNRHCHLLYSGSRLMWSQLMLSAT